MGLTAGSVQTDQRYRWVSPAARTGTGGPLQWLEPVPVRGSFQLSHRSTDSGNTNDKEAQATEQTVLEYINNPTNTHSAEVSAPMVMPNVIKLG